MPVQPTIPQPTPPVLHPIPLPVPPPVPIPQSMPIDSTDVVLQALAASRQRRLLTNAALNANPIQSGPRAMVRELCLRHRECQQFYDDCVTEERNSRQGHGRAQSDYLEQMRARQDRMDAFRVSPLGRSHAKVIRDAVQELFHGYGRRR